MKFIFQRNNFLKNNYFLANKRGFKLYLDIWNSLNLFFMFLIFLRIINRIPNKNNILKSYRNKSQGTLSDLPLNTCQIKY
jgi:hypothetical protein